MKPKKYGMNGGVELEAIVKGHDHVGMTECIIKAKDGDLE